MNDNHWNGVGRLADQAKYYPEDKARGISAHATARLIVNRMPGPDGKTGYDVIPLVAWNAHAETLRNYGTEGKTMLVRGPIRTTSRLMPDGSYDNRWEVRVERISLGPDSTKSKISKASQATGAPVEDLTDLGALLNSQEVQQALSTLAQAQPKLGVAAAKPSTKVIPSITAEDPFND